MGLGTLLELDILNCFTSQWFQDWRHQACQISLILVVGFCCCVVHCRIALFCFFFLFFFYLNIFLKKKKKKKTKCSICLLTFIFNRWLERQLCHSLGLKGCQFGNLISELIKVP